MDAVRAGRRAALRMMGSGSRVGAAIDIGSNSVHLLVAEVADGRLRPLRDLSELLGLGAIVDLEGSIPDGERAAATEALARYVSIAEEHGADPITLLATEPLRRAADRTRFCREVERAVGRPLHVLTHEEEAMLTLIGVLGTDEPTRPTLVVDIGGGSSEVALYGPGEDPVVGVLPVGSARLTAEFIESDPPTADELAAVRAEARRLATGLPVGHPVVGIVVGGSGRNLLRLVSSWEGAGLGPARDAIDADSIDRAMDLVGSYPAAELVERTGLRERRIRQMAAGAALVEAVMGEYGMRTMEVSDASLREGAIVTVAHAGDGWRAHLAALGPFPSDGPRPRPSAA